MLRRPRYRAVVDGLESGNRTRLDFVTFRTRKAAQRWVDDMNARHVGPQPLARYEVEELPLTDEEIATWRRLSATWVFGVCVVCGIFARSTSPSWWTTLLSPIISCTVFWFTVRLMERIRP